MNRVGFLNLIHANPDQHASVRHVIHDLPRGSVVVAPNVERLKSYVAAMPGLAFHEKPLRHYNAASMCSQVFCCVKTYVRSNEQDWRNVEYVHQSGKQVTIILPDGQLSTWAAQRPTFKKVG